MKNAEDGRQEMDDGALGAAQELEANRRTVDKPGIAPIQQHPAAPAPSLDAKVELQKRLLARIATLEVRVDKLKVERDGAFAELAAIDDAFERCGNPIGKHDRRAEKLVNVLTANKNMAELLQKKPQINHRGHREHGEEI